MSIRSHTFMLIRIAILALLAGFSSQSFSWDYCGSNLYHTPAAWVAGTYGSSLVWCGGTMVNPNLYTVKTCYANTGAPHTNSTNCWNNTTPTCSGGQALDQSTGACSTCPSGWSIGPSNECEPPTNCPPGQSLLTTTGIGGRITSASCVPNAPTPNQPCITYSQMQSSYCQQQAQNCTATGGTFGSVNNVNVCIPAGNQSNPPTCVSGSTQWKQNADGSSSVICVGIANIVAAPADNTPGQPIATNTTASTPTAQQMANMANNTAATAQIAQDGFQAVVNAINNNTSKTAPGGGGAGGGSTAAQDQSNSAAIVSAINANTASEHGAGTCDPHASNYSECIGQTEAAPDSDGSTLKGGVVSAGNASIDSAAENVVTGIGEAAAQSAPATGGVVDALLSYMPQAESCSDWSTSIHGVTFSIHCTETTVFREWAAWVLALLTMYAIFEIMFRRVS